MSSAFNIALCGLPSAGKSTIINSLCGKRFAQSGARRTTTSVQKFGLDDDCDQKIDLTSDDGIKFNIIDLPGMCDVEDKTREFEKFTYESACKADIIFWVTDVSHAFMTTHEREEFNKLMVHLDKKSLENGRAYQYGIIISKCDFTYSRKVIGDTDIPIKSGKNIDGEIIGDEDTTNSDILDNVHQTFPNIDIVYYNAYGRFKFHKNSSMALKLLVSGINVTKYNTQFELSLFKSKRHQCEQRSMFRHLIDTSIKQKVLNFGIVDIRCAHGQNIGSCPHGCPNCPHGYRANQCCPSCCGNCKHNQQKPNCAQCKVEFLGDKFKPINDKLSLINDPQIIQGFYEFLMVSSQVDLQSWLTKYNLSHQTYTSITWNTMAMAIKFSGFNSFEIKKIQESSDNTKNCDVVFRGMQLIGPSELSSVRSMMKFFSQTSFSEPTVQILGQSLPFSWKQVADHLPAQNEITIRFNNKKSIGCSQKFINELSELRVKLWELQEMDVSCSQVIAMYGSGAINGGLLIEIN